MNKRNSKKVNHSFQKALAIFRKNGGILRTSEVLRAGVHPQTLYDLVKAGKLKKISRGVYCLPEKLPLENPDFVIVSKRIPKGVICLISALAFYDLTREIPHEVYLALPQGAEEPRLDFPPLREFRFSEKSFTAGIELHIVDGIPIRIYSPEKTLADCFKFRNKIGLDTIIEALRLYKEREKMNISKLLYFAEICRVSKVMKPYLEALL